MSLSAGTRLGPYKILGLIGAEGKFATGARDFDVVPGGRFILTESNHEPPDAPLQLILNWLEELKARVQ